MSRSVVVHGHFYQPPRENPWTGVVDPEPTAAPFHDWNQRIETECYGPVGKARVLDKEGNVAHRDNLYASMSFDVGPTLFEWMEPNAPATYARILEADKLSVARLGYGNAIAMPYHHTILPLASRRERLLFDATASTNSCFVTCTPPASLLSRKSWQTLTASSDFLPGNRLNHAVSGRASVCSVVFACGRRGWEELPRRDERAQSDAEPGERVSSAVLAIHHADGIPNDEACGTQRLDRARESAARRDDVLD